MSARGRQCGDCTLCCKVMAIDELAKPSGSWCRHCKPGRGCLVHEQRPAECRSFNCLWLTDDRFGPHWKPNRSKLVLTASEDGIEIRCDPGFPDAWRRQPVRTDIQKLAESGNVHDVTVLVIVGDSMILVTPEQEFHLGVVRADQRILRELDGRRVVNAIVVDEADCPER
jgi:hypothetical protein